MQWNNKGCFVKNQLTAWLTGSLHTQPKMLHNPPLKVNERFFIFVKRFPFVVVYGWAESVIFDKALYFTEFVLLFGTWKLFFLWYLRVLQLMCIRRDFNFNRVDFSGYCSKEVLYVWYITTYDKWCVLNVKCVDIQTERYIKTRLIRLRAVDGYASDITR